MPEADVPCRKRRRLGPEDASAGRPNKLRRQVEYYFSAPWDYHKVLLLPYSVEDIHVV